MSRIPVALLAQTTVINQAAARLFASYILFGEGAGAALHISSLIGEFE
jgi:hypothetical protein